ncbi:MAG: beta-lactamase family protein [Bacteroidales bacterium]|jgi:CubicO group peptidase (beta-lactamase class C family)|nr:beta-lactamase family protein [Bacteroidales bacterium]
MKKYYKIIALALFSIILVCSCEKENENTLYPSSAFIAKGEYTGDYWPTESWRTCKPEEVGMNSEKLKELNEEILLLLKLHIDIHSVLIVKDGYIVAEQYYSDKYGIDSLQPVYSCTKSLTSALIGIAIDRKYLQDENTLMTGFFPEYKIENLTDDKQKITLKHMLTMSAGLDWHELDYHYNDERNTFNQWVSSSDRVKFVLDRQMVAVPGELYTYNTGISHVLSAIIKKSTGIRADSFALENIFRPLGIERYSWPVDSRGVALGGNGVQLLPRDMAKFGYLYLKYGFWDGEQIVSQKWIEISQTKHIKRNDIPDYYYGYHWWVSPENSYSAVGFGGQWITIFPEQNLVVVFTNQFKEGDNFQWSTAERLVKSYILPSIN